MAEQDFRAVRIVETFTQFNGNFPQVSTFEGVDTASLYEGDDSPFHLTLKIAEVGRKSKNGLHYDQELVDSIERQIREGVGGIRGHLRPDEESTAFPPDDVFWIGVERVGHELWAKGYIPPGQTRDDIRRKKATKQGIGTSIYGTGKREALKGGGYKLTSFQLEQLDLAPAKRAALQMNSPIAITKEMEGTEMSEEQRTISLADVPQAVREQIIREAQVAADATRVGEMETRLGEAQARVSELQARIAELEQAQSRVSELEASLSLAQVRIAEFEQAQFNQLLGSVVASFTETWKLNSDAAKVKRDALNKQFTRSLLAEIGEQRDEAAIRETALRVWESDFKVIAESIVATLSGAPAIVKPNTSADDWRKAIISPEGQAEIRKKFLS